MERLWGRGCRGVVEVVVDVVVDVWVKAVEVSFLSLFPSSLLSLSEPQDSESDSDVGTSGPVVVGAARLPSLSPYPPRRLEDLETNFSLLESRGRGFGLSDGFEVGIESRTVLTSVFCTSSVSPSESFSCELLGEKTIGFVPDCIVIVVVAVVSLVAPRSGIDDLGSIG